MFFRPQSNQHKNNDEKPTDIEFCRGAWTLCLSDVKISLESVSIYCLQFCDKLITSRFFRFSFCSQIYFLVDTLQQVDDLGKQKQPKTVQVGKNDNIFVQSEIK